MIISFVWVWYGRTVGSGILFGMVLMKMTTLIRYRCCLMSLRLLLLLLRTCCYMLLALLRCSSRRPVGSRPDGPVACRTAN